MSIWIWSGSHPGVQYEPMLLAHPLKRASKQIKVLDQDRSAVVGDVCQKAGLPPREIPPDVGHDGNIGRGGDVSMRTDRRNRPKRASFDLQF